MVGQNFERALIEFTDNGDPLNFALAGGLNNPQFSAVDLDNDGIKDLFVFDKKGHVILTFRNAGAAGQADYRFAPRFIDNFPRLSHWALLRDYNCDGIQDIFAFSQVPGVFGVEVYQGFYDQNDEIGFEKILFPEHQFNLLWYPNPFTSLKTNIVITGEDLPAVDDIDSDGDLDILTFNPGGGYVEYFKNQSVEMGYSCDSLIFHLVDDCYGRFFESGISSLLELSPDRDSCINRANFIGKSGLHVGSTLLTLDMDNDSDKELILGDLSFSNLNLLTNTLNSDTAWMTAQEDAFPANSIPVDLNTFPSSFHLDVNNDGNRDLLVSPNATNISENYFCSWLYTNTGSEAFPQFDFIKETFLVDEMIDLGTEANPVFFDHNSDGLPDLVIGTGGFFLSGGNFDARLYLFENQGSQTEPRYALVNENYGGFQGLGLRSLYPTFGDVDGDGDKDMIVGEEFGKLIFLENSDPGTGIATFSSLEFEYQGVDVGQFSTPFLVDLNRDQLLDLVIGELNGNLNYYQNTGTQDSATFFLINNFLGEVDTREPGFPVGYSQVQVVDLGSIFEFYTGGEPGNIKRYTNVEGNLISGSFIEADSNFADIFEGQRIRIHMADINNDGMAEIAIGNFRGGIAIYSMSQINTVAVTEPIQPELEISLFPNPASGLLNFSFHTEIRTENINYEIFDVLGRKKTSAQFHPRESIDISTLSNGVYLIVLQVDEQLFTLKFVKG